MQWCPVVEVLPMQQRESHQVHTTQSVEQLLQLNHTTHQIDQLSIPLKQFHTIVRIMGKVVQVAQVVQVDQVGHAIYYKFSL